MFLTYNFPDNRFPAQLSAGALPPPQAEWIHLSQPTLEECELLAAHYALPFDFLQAAIDINERPRLKHDKGCLLLVVRVPVQKASNESVPLLTYPLAIILTEKTIITVCLHEGIIEKLITHGLKSDGTRRNVCLAMTFLYRISTLFIENLRHMNEMVGTIEATLHQSMQNKELINMLRIEKSLIFSYTAIKGNQAVMEKLQSATFIDLTKKERELLGDALVENTQASNMAEVFTQVMGGISDTFGAIVSNNLNKVMKLLTALTLLFIIPSTVAALYGMNVALPYQEYPHAFVFICIVCIGFSALLAWLFWKKHWV